MIFGDDENEEISTSKEKKKIGDGVGEGTEEAGE